MPAENLAQIFSQKIFRIPDYQRGYAWKEKQLSDLWEDIEDIKEVGTDFKKHYVGALFVEEKDPSDNERWLTVEKFYDVVDGQQRLTTLSILLFVLLEFCESEYSGESKEEWKKHFLFKKNATGESKIYRFSYSGNNPNYSYLQGVIFENDKILFSEQSIDSYSLNLLYAKEFFTTKIKGLSPAEREVVFRKVTTSFMFDFRKVDDDLDVQVVFETMNNRGKKLSVFERLKNRLIFLNEKFNPNEQDKENLRKKINDCWGNVFSWLGRNPNILLDEDDFLSAFLSIYRKPKEAVFSEEEAEERIFQIFCSKPEKYLRDGTAYEEPISHQKIDFFVLCLSAAAEKWHRINFPAHKIEQKLLILNRNKDLKVLFLSLFLIEKNDSNISEILVQLEKAIFRNRVPGLWIFDERTLATWARNLFSEEKAPADFLTSILELNSKDANPISLLNSFKPLFDYERGPKGFYRWGALKYFLFEYEEYLRMEFGETDYKVTLRNYDSTSVEHIIPSHYWENWTECVKEFTGKIIETKSGMAPKILINTLGNLTILKNGKNSSLGNRSWNEKQVRFTTGSFNEIEVSKFNNWDHFAVFSRGKKLINFLCKKVGMKALNDEQIGLLLFYDQDFFVERQIENIDSENVSLMTETQLTSIPT